VPMPVHPPDAFLVEPFIAADRRAAAAPRPAGPPILPPRRAVCVERKQALARCVRGARSGCQAGQRWSVCRHMDLQFGPFHHKVLRPEMWRCSQKHLSHFYLVGVLSTSTGCS